jgi:GAF domain-containing protein
MEVGVDNHGTMAGEIDAILSDLLAATGASRVTLRRALPGEYAFPVTDEVLAAGVGSLREERSVDLRTQPVALEVGAGRQVVQDDCAAAYDDPAFHRMREVYGGLAAQIVTPVQRDGEVIGIVSLHQLATPRRWTEAEIAACRETATRVGGLL